MPDQPQQQSGFLGTLKSKFGPLPVWGWLALITVVLLAYWLYQQHKAGGQQQTSPITGQPGVVVINQGDTDQTAGPAPKKKPKGKGKGTGDDDDSGGKRHRHHHHKPQGAMTPPVTAESKNGTALPAMASTGQLQGAQPFPAPAPSPADVTMVQDEDTG